MEESMEYQKMHTASEQRDFWSRVQNEDPFYKLLAYETVIDQQKKELAE
jgi:hypothetical protein